MEQVGPYCDSAAAHLAYGYYYCYAVWDAAAAEIEFKRVIALQPQNSDARVGLSLVEQRLDHWRSAADWQEQALSLDPRNVELLTSLHLTRALQRDFAGALEMSNRALAVDPDNLRAAKQSALAELYGFGDPVAALRTLDAVPTNRRNDPALLFVRFEVLMMQRQFVNACELAKSLPDDGTNWFEVARCRAGLGSQAAVQIGTRRALKVLDAAAPANSQDWEYLSLHAKTLVGLGRFEEAVNVCRQIEALVSAPNFSSPVDRLIARGYVAETYAMMDRPAEAVSRLRELLEQPAGVAITIPRLKLDPVWDPIRSDPGFMQLIAQDAPTPT